ncbi:hypothetical protein PAXRUDRAFT_833808 [Paxillus rubicundulus Ve08.2h10]|uniref:Uncharacterized protein n=1 Tax=Paxillus rubicundulus Ve08.2h10 TaxID=930991 RepID=A0A0D0DFV6_9AGAM|nr:hypothetical protein PAXRUDRAFT_833808 [Paxillus rubicundulus Ve08.2h10]
MSWMSATKKNQEWKGGSGDIANPVHLPTTSRSDVEGIQKDYLSYTVDGSSDV